MPGCATLRGRAPRVPPQQPACQRLLGQVAAQLQARDLEALARLFTADCRSSCRGFIPHPIAARGRSIRARWMARLEDGGLLGDLELLLRSYERIERAALQLRQLRAYRDTVLIRAELLVQGPAAEGRRLADQGLVDLELRRGGAGWRIAALRPARLDRVLLLRPDEEALVAGAAGAGVRSSPANRGDGGASSADRGDPRARAGERRGDERGDQAAGDSGDERSGDERSADERSGERSGGERGGETGGDDSGRDDAGRDGAASARVPLPPALLELKVRGPGGEQRLAKLAGERATLLLVSAGKGAGELCRQLEQAVRGRAGVRAVSLLLGESRGETGCGLTQVRAARSSLAQLRGAASLLPLVAVLDGAGRIVRLAAALTAAQLEADLDRLAPPQ